MPAIAPWGRLPLGVREHQVQRMRDRAIRLEDLDRLRVWLGTKPEVPEGAWFKDFGSFKLCGEGSYPKTFLLAGQAARGAQLD